MRAVRFEPGGPAVLEAPEPSGDGVVIDVCGVGICGSDLSMIHAGGIPWIPGHEIVGYTPAGEAVAVQPNQPCGVCELCVSEQSHLCPQSMELFLGVNGRDGGFAEQVLVPETLLRPLPLGMDMDLAALSEPASVALHALRRLDPSPGSAVLIVGSGAIGLIAAAMAVASGHRVTIVARHPQQRAAAEAAGAHVAAPEVVLPSTYRFILDTAGAQSAMDIAYAAAAPGARIVSVGCGDWAVRTSLACLMKEISILGSIIYTRREFEQAIEWLVVNDEFARSLVTHRFALAAAVDAFAAAGARADSGAIKVLVKP